MTEKRFTIKEFSTLDAMSSLDVICDNGIELPSSTACDLLNELSTENEQLKEALIELKKIGDYQYARINELSDENEQLEQQMQQLKHWNKCLAEKRHQELSYHNYTDCKKEIEDLLKPKRMNCSDR